MAWHGSSLLFLQRSVHSLGRRQHCFVSAESVRRLRLLDVQWMQSSCPGLDDVFLEELLLSDSSPRVRSPFARSPMDVPRKKGGFHTKRNKAPDYPLEAPTSVVRQALFPSGPGSYPSHIMPLHQPQQNRQQLTRQQVENWTRDLPNEHKWREMGWNTSYPAEYLLQANNKDYKQTLAYAEELRSRQETQDLQGIPDADSTTGIAKSPTKTFGAKSGYFPRSTSFSNTTTTATTRGVAEIGSAQSEEERTLLKHAMVRESWLAKLHDLTKAATPPQSLLQPHLPPKEPKFDISKGTEVLHLLLQLRDAGVTVMESILRWHELRIRLAPMVPLVPFRFENHNYCAKMISDLNFLSASKSLGAVLGINPATMKQNPFMMPKPIPERDFGGFCELPWRSLRLSGNKDDPVRRVEDAEKYLVWCLFNLHDAPSNSPLRPVLGSTSPSPSSLKKREQQQKLTWQKRAEKQLEMLSMPLESLAGPTYVMDSSRLMKRKGVLPSLPQSPPKTLRELMENVHEDADSEYCDDNNRSRFLRTRWSGQEFSASAADFEELGACKAPPHHMVTLVSASVLILLSPSDRLPKDLSWHSCQKMLRNGGQLIERVQTFDVTRVPGFKWKALVPFLQNEHFQPKFLAQFSGAASSLCAWIFSVLRAAQQQDYERLGLHTSSGADAGGDEDRLVLLSELEVDAAGSPRATANNSPTSWQSRPGNEASLPPLSHSRSGKRVSIGDAEILFINENQPVVCTPRGFSRSSSRRSESPPASNHKKKEDFIISSLRSGGESSALLRTSPWSYRGVVYFVSFFLQGDKLQSQQQEDDDSGEQRHLLIKIYEPMSSVESQMVVETEDLRQDFGEEVLAAFQSGEYRALCDLMLRQLDRMMGAADGRKAAPPSTPPAPNALDLLLQDSEGEQPELSEEGHNDVGATEDLVREGGSSPSRQEALAAESRRYYESVEASAVHDAVAAKSASRRARG